MWAPCCQIKRDESYIQEENSNKIDEGFYSPFFLGREGREDVSIEETETREGRFERLFDLGCFVEVTGFKGSREMRFQVVDGVEEAGKRRDQVGEEKRQATVLIEMGEHEDGGEDV